MSLLLRSTYRYPLKCLSTIFSQDTKSHVDNEENVLAAVPKFLRGIIKSDADVSSCNLEATWIVSSDEDLCELRSFDGGAANKFCTKDRGFSLFPDDDGTLLGESYILSAEGELLMFDLIGFWNKDDCSFNAVSTTTSFTIEGQVTGDNQMFIKALRPGVAGAGTPPASLQIALAFQGKLEKGTLDRLIERGELK